MITLVLGGKSTLGFSPNENIVDGAEVVRIRPDMMSKASWALAMVKRKHDAATIVHSLPIIATLGILVCSKVKGASAIQRTAEARNNQLSVQTLVVFMPVSASVLVL